MKKTMITLGFLFISLFICAIPKTSLEQVDYSQNRTALQLELSMILAQYIIDGFDPIALWNWYSWENAIQQAQEEIVPHVDFLQNQGLSSSELAAITMTASNNIMFYCRGYSSGGVNGFGFDAE